MDSNFTTQLTLSMLFFAPGVLLLAGLAFVGLLMLLEKTVFAKTAMTGMTAPQAKVTADANPAPGEIVEGLKTAIAKEGAPEQKIAANGGDAGKR